jgi:hypothetical protein
LGSVCSLILQTCPSHLNHELFIIVAKYLLIKLCKFYISAYCPYSYEYLSFPDINLRLIFCSKCPGTTTIHDYRPRCIYIALLFGICSHCKHWNVISLSHRVPKTFSQNPVICW